ncbi:MAG: bactofilin family protein [Acetivibrionales bacterium]|jgi:cytoskeletal protein CcmA (bactofilin family)
MFGKKSTGFKEEFDTLLGKNAIFEGNIELEGSIRVDGKIKGDLNIKGNVFVGTEALITGSISADSVHLAGTVEGNIYAAGTLKMFSTAKLYGDIEVNSFITDEGAIFHGKCSMLQSTPEENQEERKTHIGWNYKKSSVLDQVYDEKEESFQIEDDD